MSTTNSTPTLSPKTSEGAKLPENVKQIELPKPAPAKITMDKLVKFLATTSGIDKTVRFIQYFTKTMKPLVAAHLAKQPKELQNPKLVEFASKLDLLGGSLSLTRRVLRYGRPVGFLYNIYKTWMAYQAKKKLSPEEKKYDKGADPVFVVFRILNLITSTIDFTSDNCLWFYRVKILNNNKVKDTLDSIGTYAWFYDCIISVICDIIELRFLTKKWNDHKGNEKVRNEVKEEMITVFMDILLNICDWLIAVSYMWEGSISNLTVGVCGMISSVIAGWNYWPSN